MKTYSSKVFGSIRSYPMLSAFNSGFRMRFSRRSETVVYLVGQNLKSN